LRRLVALTLFLASLITLAFQPRQQKAVEFENFSQDYTFGDQLAITGTINSPSPVTEAALYLQPFGEAATSIVFQPDATGDVKLTYNLKDKPVRAYSPVEYWFQVKFSEGEPVTSPVYSFLYADTRFEWQQLDTETFSLSWSEGGVDFGTELKNVTMESLAVTQGILPVKIPAKLRIVVYPSSQDMQSATQLTASPWAAGHTNPDLGLILISVAPGPDARAEMERQIPHEIMHILEYQVAGSSYNQIPVWLLEGLASSAELYPNPEYQRVLDKAVDEDALLPMSVLCQDFPRDLSGALLAYAQSGSFVRFLNENFGSRDTLTLLNLYSDGLSCEVGLQAAFGSNLAQLESQWQQNMLGRSPVSAAWKQIWPYVLLAGLVILPISLTLVPARRKTKETLEAK
jgi:hypothetical protein